MKITEREAPNRATIDWENGEELQDFWAPIHGGYVYNVTHKSGTLGRQVCRRMYYTGHTLSWNPCTGSLAKLLRKEAAKFKYDEKKLDQ